MRKKIALISIPTGIIGIGISALLAIKFHSLETQAIKKGFQQQIDGQVYRLETTMDAKMDGVNSLKLLFDNSDEVKAQEFQQFSQSILAKHKVLQALEWVPRVKQTEREVFVKRRQQDFSAFEFTQKTKQGTLVQAQQRSEYFPVYFIEPLAGNKLGLGYDLGSSALHKRIMDVARDTGTIQALTNVTLVQETQNLKGFITFVPLYQGQPNTLTSRRQRLQGFVLGIYRVGDLVNKAMQPGALDAINLKLLDTSDTGQKSLLYTRSSQLDEPLSEHTYHKDLKPIAGHKWTLVATPSRHYFRAERTGTPFLVFCVGFIFVVLGEAYIIFILRQSEVIETVVKARTQELEDLNRELELMSTTDELTHVSNRRYFNIYLEREWKRAIREQTPMTLFLINIDFFRQFNEGYGSDRGDGCLKALAQHLQSMLKRPADMVARYEGETFALVLPNTANALPLAQRCREAIEGLKIKHSYSPITPCITVSIGIGFVRPTHDIPMQKLVDQTAQALIRAKDAGRNQVAFNHIPSTLDVQDNIED